MKKKDPSDIPDIAEDLNGVVSSTECTGMMYFPPQDEYEAESYGEIYNVPEVPNETEKLQG